MATGPAPDVHYIRSLLSSCEATYQDDDTQIEEGRRVREMTQDIGLPKDLITIPIEIRDPTASDEIMRVVATLAKNPPTWHVLPGSPTDEAVSAATRLEHWTEQTLLRNAARRTPGEDTWRFAVDACVGDGGAWTKLLHTPDTWEERYNIRLSRYQKAGKSVDEFTEDVDLAKKRAGPPFLWKSVDALTVYPVWEGGTLAEMVEVYARDTLPVARRYGVEPPHMGQAIARPYSNMSSMGRWIEHWTKDGWCTYMCEGGVFGNEPMMLKQFKHGYDRVPYFYAPGLVMNHWRGRKVGWGVAQTKRWLVELRSLLYTLAVQDMGKQLGSPLLLERPDTAEPIIGENGDTVSTRELTLRLNGLIETGPGMRISNIQQSSVTPAIKEMLSYVSAVIDSVNTPRPASEIGSALAGAGFAVAQVLAEVMTKHDPFVKSLQYMMEEVTEFCWYLTRYKVKETVYTQYQEKVKGRSVTRWVGVSPEDLSKVVGVQVEIDPQDASAKLVDARLNTELVQAKRLSNDQAIEAEGRNPDEVREGILMDQMRNEDWYKAAMMMRTMQAVGRGDLLPQAALMAASTGMIPGMSPELQKLIMAQRQLALQYQQANQQGTPQAQPQAAMGSREIPDMGQAAGGPGAPTGQPSAPASPPSPNTPGSVMGAPATPMRSAAPGMQGPNQ